MFITPLSFITICHWFIHFTSSELRNRGIAHTGSLSVLQTLVMNEKKQENNTRHKEYWWVLLAFAIHSFLHHQ